MTIVCVIGAILGAGLAQRFKAFVLPPAILIAASAACLAELAEGHTPFQAMLSGLSVVIAVQIGFFAGVFIRASVDRALQGSAAREETAAGATLPKAEAEFDDMLPLLDNRLSEMRQKLRSTVREANKQSAV